MELTARQRRILEFIRSAVRARGEAPSYREIGRRFGIASTNGVRDHLLALERKGHLRISDRRRGILLENASFALPVVGQVPAGRPSLAEQQVEERITIGGEFGEGAFGLRVRGDSMTGAGILDGDIVVVQPGAAVRSGDVAVVMIDGEATVKRLVERGARVILEAANPAYEPIVLERGAPASIVGKVIGLIRRMG